MSRDDRDNLAIGRAPANRSAAAEPDEVGDEINDHEIEDLRHRTLRLDPPDEAQEESPFLRAQKRVAVRRGPLPRKAANRLKQAAMATAVLGSLAGVAAAAYFYGTSSWRFRIDSRDNIEITGVEHVPTAQVMEVFGGDVGRNIYYIPLAERKKQLEEIPWVESAAVMRLLPNRLRVAIKERTPVAFVRMGSRVQFIDAGGVIMELPQRSAKKFSFPLILGMNDAEPLSTRAARMKIFNNLAHSLDSEGGRYSRDLSEVDLSDPEDVKITVADPQGAVLVHLGSSDFLPRYKVYIAHVQEWRQQFSKLESVDLRYDRQVIVNPDTRGQGDSSPAASKPVRLRTPVTRKSH